MSTPSSIEREFDRARNIVASSRRVLLLLDVQNCMLSDDLIGVPPSHDVRKNLPDILACARKAVPPPLIIHVRNTGDAGDPDELNTPGWHLIYSPEESELVIDKMKNNAFAGTRLEEIIPEDVEIVMAGFQTDFSVIATCIAALDRGNEVLLIKGGHATYDRMEMMHGGKVLVPGRRIEAVIEARMEDLGVHVLDMKDLPDIFTGR